MTHDHTPSDTAAAFGMAVSMWQWLTAGMSPLSVLLTLASLALVALRIREAIQRRKLMKEFGEVNKSTLRRMVDAISTKPGDLKD
jgi:hypothetical protein